MHFDPVVNYLPHDPPMILIDQIIDVTDKEAICQVTVDSDGVLAPFLNKKNELPAWFALEMMAQTIGVWQGWHAKKTQKDIHLGLLLGGRGFKTAMPCYPLNTILTIHVTLLLLDTKLASFDCRLIVNDKEMATARLNVYQPDDVELKQFMGKD